MEEWNWNAVGIYISPFYPSASSLWLEFYPLHHGPYISKATLS